MPIILARTAGFCFGVRRAVKIALDAAQDADSNLVTIGPLIHNQQAIDLLKSRGIGIVGEPEEVAKGGRVLIRAHGITPEVRKRLVCVGARICDATCPHVTSTQRIVERQAKGGCACIIVGDRGHAEVEALLGFARWCGYVVESERDVANLPSLKRVCVVSQTTQEVEHFQRLVIQIKKRFPDAIVFNTICNATSRRQREVIEIAKKCDVVVVVGGRLSANTKRLVEISRKTRTRTIHVETADELALNDISPRDIIGVTAGTSTPHWVIRNVVEVLLDFQLKKKNILQRFVIGLLHFLIYSSVLLAIGAGMLTYGAAFLMGQNPAFLQVLLAFLFVLSMHLMNKRLSLPGDERLLYGSLKSFARYKDAFTVLALFCVGSALVVALSLGTAIFALVSLSAVLGFVYSITLLPKGLAGYFRHHRLMDIPGSKDIFMAGAWGVVVVLIPHIISARKEWLGFAFTLPLVLVLVLNRSILLDVRDLEGDIALGKETIPILLGPRWSRRIIGGMSVFFFLLLLAGWGIGVFPTLALFLIILVPYLLLHYPLSRRQVFYQSLLYDGYLEGQFLLAGALTFLWELLRHAHT